MDKKTKLWLGAGILGVGAYLLLKSKKAAAVVSAPANLVGFDSGSFYEPQTAKYGVGEGVFANQTGRKGSVKVGPLDKGGFVTDSTRKGSVKVGPLDKGSFEKFASQDGTSFFDVRGGHAGVSDEAVFANAAGLDKNLGKLTNRKGFANQPFNFSGTEMDPVGQRKMPFAANIGDNEKFANAGGILDRAKAAWKSNKYLPQWGTEATSVRFAGEVGDNEKFNATGGSNPSFFDVNTAKYGDNQGVFAAAETKMNSTGKESTGLINGPAVHQVWVNR